MLNSNIAHERLLPVCTMSDVEYFTNVSFNTSIGWCMTIPDGGMVAYVVLSVGLQKIQWFCNLYWYTVPVQQVNLIGDTLMYRVGRK